MIDVSPYVVVCPKNDPESLQILQLCDRLHIATVVSPQPHGALLKREVQLHQRLSAANPLARHVVIIELPGLAEEEQLRGAGYDVIIIDHHAYGTLDRTRRESSLEQFLALIKITDHDLIEHNFDPLLVKGVGCIDRGFLWELGRAGYTREQAAVARAYYESFAKTLARANAPSREELQTIWDHRQEKDGIIILTSAGVTIADIREGMSYLLAEYYPEAEPPVIIVQKDKIVVQGITCGERLLEKFDGYLFGAEKCWGKQGSPTALPAIADILATIR